MIWNVDPVLIALGPIQIRWYSLMFFCGFFLGYQGMRKIFQWEKRPIEVLDSLLTHLVLGTIIGARLGHCLFYEPEYYLPHPLEILKIWEGGLASHGGIAGVIFAIFLFQRKYPEFTFIWLLDRLSIFTMMTCGFIRIGNLMNSEILGRPADVPWAFTFVHVDQIPRHPAQLYESLSYLFITFIGWKIYLKYKRDLAGGLVFGFYMATAFTARMILEVFKENQVPFENNIFMNMGQLLSIPFIFIGIYLFVRALKIQK